MYSPGIFRLLLHIVDNDVILYLEDLCTISDVVIHVKLDICTWPILWFLITFQLTLQPWCQVIHFLKFDMAHYFVFVLLTDFFFFHGCTRCFWKEKGIQINIRGCTHTEVWKQTQYEPGVSVECERVMWFKWNNNLQLVCSQDCNGLRWGLWTLRRNTTCQVLSIIETITEARVWRRGVEEPEEHEQKGRDLKGKSGVCKSVCE